MKRQILSVLLSILPISLLVGQTTDANLTLGDSFRGVISSSTDVDVVEFFGLEGELVILKLKPRGKQVGTLSMTVEGLGPAVRKGKQQVIAGTLLESKLHRITISCPSGGCGEYQLKTTSRLKRLDVPVPEGTQPTASFWAREGMRLSATIIPPAGPWELQLSSLDPVGIDRILTGELKGNPAKGVQKLKNSVVPATALYELTGSVPVPLSEVSLRSAKRKKSAHFEPGSGLSIKKPLINSLEIDDDGPFYPGQEIEVLVGIGSKKPVDIPLTLMLVSLADLAAAGTGEGSPTKPAFHIVSETTIFDATATEAPRSVYIQIPDDGQIDTDSGWRLMAHVDPLDMLSTKSTRGLYAVLWTDLELDPVLGAPWYDVALDSLALPSTQIDVRESTVDALPGDSSEGAGAGDHQDSLFSATIAIRRSPGLQPGDTLTVDASTFSAELGLQSLLVWGVSPDAPLAAPDWHLQGIQVEVPPNIALGPDEHLLVRLQMTFPETVLAQIVGMTQPIDAALRVQVNNDLAFEEAEQLFTRSMGDNQLTESIRLIPPGPDVAESGAEEGQLSSFNYEFADEFVIPATGLLRDSYWVKPPLEHIVKGGAAGLLAGELDGGGFFGILAAAGCTTFPFASTEPGIGPEGVAPSDEILICGQVVAFLDIATDDQLEPFKFLLEIELVDETVLSIALPEDLPDPSAFSFDQTWEFCFELSQDFSLPVPKGTKKSKRRSAFGGIPFVIEFVLEGCSKTRLTAEGVQDFSNLPASSSLGLDVGFENRETITLAVVFKLGFLNGIIYAGGEVVVTLFDVLYDQQNSFSLEAQFIPVPAASFTAQLDVTKELDIGAADVNIFVQVPNRSLECSLENGFFPICEIVEEPGTRPLELQLLALPPVHEDDITISKKLTLEIGS